MSRGDTSALLVADQRNRAEREKRDLHLELERIHALADEALKDTDGKSVAVRMIEFSIALARIRHHTGKALER